MWHEICRYFSPGAERRRDDVDKLKELIKEKVLKLDVDEFEFNSIIEEIRNEVY